MTRLAWDPAVTFEEEIALGGWSTQSNRDHYVWITVPAILPPALCLAGYPDCRVIPYMPSLGMLFHHQQLSPGQRFEQRTYEKFLRQLYVCDLPEFWIRDTPQRNLMVLVTAVMVMHFDYFYTKYSVQHPYCHKMADLILQSGVPFADTRARSIELLQKWSRIVKDDFMKGNCPGNEQRFPLGRRTIVDEVSKINANIAHLAAFKVEMQHTLQKMHDRQDEMNEELAKVNTRTNTIVELLDCVVSQNRLIQFRMNDLCRHLNLPIADLPETPDSARRSQVVAAAVARQLQRQPNTAQNSNSQNGQAATPTANTVTATRTATSTNTETPGPPQARQEVPIPRRQDERRELVSVNVGLQRPRSNVHGKKRCQGSGGSTGKGTYDHVTRAK